MPFTQSPIEASIWMTFVDLQQWVAGAILVTPVFKAAVATWMGLLFIRAVAQGFASGNLGMALGRFVIALGYSALGLAILRAKSTADFRPVDARGAAWAESARVKASGRHDALNASVQGLRVYVMIHQGAADVAALISNEAALLFRDQHQTQSPYLLLQTLAQTAGATIDDPKVVSSLTWLSENCTDRREAPLLTATSSYANLFDLRSEACKERYGTLRQDLKAWAAGKWGSSGGNAVSLGLQQLAAKLGAPLDEEALQNKMIASALVNLARSQQGQRFDNVHAGALLGTPGDSVFGSSTTFFVAMDNALSTAGVASGALGRLTGIDFFAADGRNKSAALYNKIVQYIPPIRGYAKGLLALAFVFAASGLCFGTPRFMLAWFGMLILFTAYEPLSTILYETTMLFTNAQETTDAMGALKSDPLVLAGAAIIDDNLARIQAVYFALQMGLAAVCGAGGMSIFVFSKRLGGGLADGLVSKVGGITQAMTRAGV